MHDKTPTGSAHAYRCNCNEVKVNLLDPGRRTPVGTHGKAGSVVDFRLDDFLPWQLAELAERVSRGLSGLYRDKFGISVAEWRVVAHLSQAEKVSVREIHARVRMGKWQVSRAAQRLESRGYIRKRTGRTDRRLVELSLTPKGRAMVNEIIPLALEYEKELLARVSGKREAKDLIRSLLKSMEASN